MSVLAGLTMGAAVAAAASGSPPAVPACWAGTGQCGPFYLRTPGTPLIKMPQGKKGDFELQAPGSVTSTDLKTPAGHSEDGPFYHHWDWSVAGEEIGRGCQTNDPKCDVTITPGLKEWSYVMVSLDSFPAAVYLLWEPGQCQSGSATASTSVTLTMKNKNVFPHRACLKVGGKVIFCDHDHFMKEPYLQGTKRALPSLRVPGGGCRSVRVYEAGTYQVFDALHPKVHGQVTVVK